MSKVSKSNQFATELNSIVRNRKVVIPVIAIMLVPLLYSALFLGAFWDPYARLSQVPVAIVNEDKGAALEGEQISIGNEFVDKLKEKDEFAWEFVSKQEALEGLENNHFYMMVQIPERFSEQAVSLTSDTPEQAELIYIPNEGYNFLAAQIGDTAVSKLAEELNKQMTSTYVESVYNKIGDALEGLQEASEGAKLIADGAHTAKEGSDQLADGQGALGDGLSQLKGGAGKLSEAGSKLSNGLSELATGGAALQSGLKQLDQGALELQGGVSKMKEQYAGLDAGLQQSSEGTTNLKQGAMQLQAGLEQMAAQNSQLASNEAFQSLLAGSQALTEGLLAKEQGEASLVAGSGAVVQGLDGLNAGTAKLSQGIQQVSSGGGALTAGAQSAADGASQLSQGLSQLPGSIDKLIEGNVKLLSGTNELSSGLGELQDGADELADGLGVANGESLNLTLTDEMKDQFAKPVHVEKESFNIVPNYGTGFAPYFISLGLYVGGMLLTIVYSMREPAIRPSSGTSWYMGKTSMTLLIAILQAVITSVAMLFILDLDVANIAAYVGMAIMTSVAFMMLIQLLCTTMNDAGRFIAIVLLILQLTSSAGTFPIELVPGWLQALNPLLPMTYTVLGFKQAITSGDMGIYWDNGLVLIGFAVVCSLLNYVYMAFSYRKTFQVD